MLLQLANPCVLDRTDAKGIAVCDVAGHFAKTG
jgi:hypothetical protein